MTQHNLPPGKLMRFDKLEPGMRVMSPNGIVTVGNTYDVHVPETMYEILTDASDVPLKASGNHLWYIETANDRSMHRMRLKYSQQVLRPLPDSVRSALEMHAEDTTGIAEERSLSGMLEIVEDLESSTKAKHAVFSRIAKSIGHVAEEETVIQDLGSHDKHRTSTMKMYNATVFSQQVLALTGERKYRKRWIVKVGQVVTTEDLVHLYRDAELPVMNML